LLCADDRSTSHVHPVLIDVIQEAAGQLHSVGCLIYKVRESNFTVLQECTLVLLMLLLLLAPVTVIRVICDFKDNSLK